MKRILPICAAIFIATAAWAEDFQTHTLVILDDSGTAQDHATIGQKKTSDRPSLRRARLALLDRLERDLNRDDMVTIVSVAVPQVIWQGEASDLLDRNNYVLARFLLSQFNGCANFDTVVDTAKRQVAQHPMPVESIYVMSSLIHTGGNTREPGSCKKPTLADIAPPEETLAGFVELQKATNAKLNFLWAHDEVDEFVTDYFVEAKIPFVLLGERQTLVELSQ